MQRKQLAALGGLWVETTKRLEGSLGPVASLC
jgi:hypothetical protein